MSKLGKTINSLVKLSVLTAGAIYGINKYIESTAISNNMLDSETGNYATWSHGKVFYNKTGFGSPILLLHDVNPAASGYEWNDIVGMLAKEHTVYVVDLPGCGRSTKIVNETYINYLYVRFIKEFIDEVIGEKTEVVATGLSGSFVVMAASIHEDIIDKITLINPIHPKKLSSIITLPSKMIKMLLDCPIFGTFLYYIDYNRNQIEKKLADKFYDPATVMSSDLIHTYYESAHLSKANGKYLLSSLYGNYMGINIERAFHSLSNNITLIFGKENPNAMKTSDEYSKINPNIRSIYLAKSKMLPQMEVPVKLVNYLNK